MILCDPKLNPVQDEGRAGDEAPPALPGDDLSKENVGGSSGTEARLYPAKCAELQVEQLTTDLSLRPL